MASGRKQGLIEADSSLHLKSKASAMAFTTTSRKALLVASLALCIGLAVTLGVLYGVYVGQEPASCKSYSAGNKGGSEMVCCKGLQRNFSPWVYSCENSQCVKKPGKPTQRHELLSSCKLTCGKFGGIWPRPRNRSNIANTTVPITPKNIKLEKITCLDAKCDKASTLLKRAFSLFVGSTMSTCSSETTTYDPSYCSEKVKENSVQVQITIKSHVTKLTLDTSEIYSLIVSNTNGKVVANITADTFFGARHALESLSQLIGYDMLSDSLQIVSSAEIIDSPAFPYRGLMLDTSRNFFSVKSILRVLDGMSYNKLNTFHWHITDTHSFPIVIPKLINMSLYGAYSEKQRYTVQDVEKILDHATLRGIRVLPEFDQPAHTGNGWQWGEGAGLGKLAFCINREPWSKYCAEPPCGQLNPLNKNTYDVLGTIYKDYIARFQPDLFHFGGDEVNIACWNTSQEIIDWMVSHNKSRKEEDFIDLWDVFLQKAKSKFKEEAKQDIPLIVWSSKMTNVEYLTKYLDNQTYIIHLWNLATDKSIPNILKNGFKVILSNYDHTYLDCGFGSWVADGNNWCSPYKQWQLQYNLNPSKFVAYFNLSSARTNQILGGETNMWSEQVDENSLEMKLWPRSAALAERMWSNPTDSWRLAEQRLMHHRQVLVDRGIQADALKPTWCYQNSGLCV